MNFNFIFSNLDIIFLVVWIIFFIIVAVRFVRPLWVKNVSYTWLVLCAAALHLFYVIVVTWGQYHVWAIGSDLTRTLLSSPLPMEAPLPSILEWSRSYLNQPLGYFAYYAFGRFFLSVLILFAVAGLLFVVFKIVNKYRGGLGEHGPELLLVLMLISGWPGVLLLIPLALILAALFLILPRTVLGRFIQRESLDGTWEERRIYIEQAFLVATPLALLFARPLLAHFHLLAFLTV